MMDNELLVESLERSGDFRVLRRMRPIMRFAELDTGPVGKALVVDVETTGLDLKSDVIIELAAIPVFYNKDTGGIFHLDEPVSYLEDPKREISSEVTALTGITNAMVAGQAIDDSVIEALAKSTDLVIAHNAAFDRNMIQKRLGVFKDMPWACSIKDVPWKDFGLSSAALDYLLTKHCGLFHDGHRAVNDCHAVIQLLATPFKSGQLPYRLLLESSSKRTIRIWAISAPFETKDILKARGYRWNSGDDGRPKAWYLNISEDKKDAEIDWLTQQIYRGNRAPLKLETFDAKSRYLE